MDTARTERAARVRRILLRAAVVAGGIAAGWLLSTASASADTTSPATDPDVVKPVVDALGKTSPTQVQDFVENVLPEPPAPPADLEQVGQQVQDAVQQVATHLNLPAKTKLTEPTAPTKLRLLSTSDHDASPVVQPTAASPLLVPVVSTVVEHAATHDHGRAHVADSSRRAPPVTDQQPALPALPPLPLPMPLPAPAAPAGACNSCGTGSNDDFGLPVAHIWPNPRSGFATSQALRLISQHVSPAAGEQPGVTPD